MDIKTIDVNTCKAWLDKGEAILIDVREQSEHKAKNIPGAISIPLGVISIGQLPENNGKKVVIHCGGGGRAGKACAKLLTEDSDIEIYNLSGGIRAWIAAGNAVNISPETEGKDNQEGKYCLLSKTD